MLLCGLQSQETLDLRLGDLDFDDHRMRMHGKGNKERAVPLTGLLVNPVRRYLRLDHPQTCATDHVFVALQGKRRGHPMTRAALRRVFRTRRGQSPRTPIPIVSATPSAPTWRVLGCLENIDERAQNH